MRNNKRSLLAITVLLICAFILSRCINETQAFNDPRGKRYAGATTCRQCHQAIYDSVLTSAHFNATMAASKESIHGDFTAGQNSFIYDQHITVAMEERKDGLYQVVYKDGKEIQAKRFDITFGTRHAQTWLYWDSGSTFELPVSWYKSVNRWGTSPGFSAKQPDFTRFIGKDCYECHSSHIASTLNASTKGIQEELLKNTLVYGIDCERCHGPGANHVNYHLENPAEKTAKYIALYSTMSRQQKLDACALCHSGNDKLKLESRFRFRPGDSLSNFFMESSNPNKKTDFDVHGNQYRLLAESKCFMNSKTMTCSSCHDPHRSSASTLLLYSQKCMNCHKDVVHNKTTMAEPLAINMQQNCIDCHMPMQSSSAISFYLPGNDQKMSYLLRTHRIAVYNDSIQKNKN